MINEDEVKTPPGAAANAVKSAFTASGGVFACAPSGARFQQVQVLNPPGSGKDIAESKGVHREVKSEG
ncbi:MAG: hypothetical protein MR868_10405, partial [Lachnospiraceae bacterium]|nr:hypothetical protein [Lachnospiraceae bacterium]